jgi:hypothetical protein
MWTKPCEENGSNLYKEWMEHAFINELRLAALAQAVSHWLPTAVAPVRVRAAWGVYGGQRGTGAGFLLVPRFPCQSVHQFLHQ